MFDFFFYLFNNLKTVEIASETPVEVWIIKRYKTLFKCHVKDQTWAESEFNRMRVELGEYGIGNPVIVVINAMDEKRITGHAICRQEFENLYGNLPVLNNDQVAADRDAEYEELLKSVEELEASYNLSLIHI